MQKPRGGSFTGVLLLSSLCMAAPAVAGTAHHKAKSHAPGKAQAAEKEEAKPTDDAPEADQPGDGEGQGQPGGLKLKPIVGPQKVEAGHEVLIDLPEGFMFLDAPQAKALMERMGNLQNDDLLGVITEGESSWFVTVRYTEDGYVKDDEAEKMDADEILKAIREGTEEANKERAKRGFPSVDVMGWSQPPSYERSVHHLVWGIKGHSAGDEDDVVNFNTRVLGRRGFVSLNLIDGSKTIDSAKPAAAKLLVATSFKPGARYQDFDSKTDKVAEYGLAALVLGGAGVGALKLVKIGLLAKFGAKLIAILFALKKALVLVIIAAFALLKKVFGRKKQEEVAAAPVPVAPASVPEQHPTEGGPGGQGGA